MIELGLSRISQLVKQTPLTWKAVHIAGTNGKGSVASYLSGLLQRGGIRTGRFTSPPSPFPRSKITSSSQGISAERRTMDPAKTAAQLPTAGNMGASRFADPNSE